MYVAQKNSHNQTKEADVNVGVVEKPSISRLPQITSSTADWKVYRNEKYGFEIKYPKNLRITKCISFAATIIHEHINPILCLAEVAVNKEPTDFDFTFTIESITLNEYLYFAKNEAAIKKDEDLINIIKTLERKGIKSVGYIFYDPPVAHPTIYIHLPTRLVLIASTTVSDDYRSSKKNQILLFENIIKTLKIFKR